MHDLIIIGGGPAGITAGIYAARKKIKTMLVAKNFIGQVGVSGIIENWPGEIEIIGPNLMLKFEEHLRAQEIEIKEEEVVTINKGNNFVVQTNKNNFEARTIIVATGRKPRKIDVPGEKEYTGKGVVYCTTCDAPLFKDRRVVVVGGGNTGFESAIELTEHAKEVFLFEKSSSVLADEILQEKAKQKNIKIFTDCEITKIEGENFVKKIIYKERIEAKEMLIDGVFIQVGSIPTTNFLGNLVELNQEKEIIINERTCQTKTDGLFAAGDVTNIIYKQIVTATGEGAKAALSTYNYLKK